MLIFKAIVVAHDNLGRLPDIIRQDAPLALVVRLARVMNGWRLFGASQTRRQRMEMIPVLILDVVAFSAAGRCMCSLTHGAKD